MLKQWVATIGWSQLIVIGALTVMWLLEQWLGATKRVKANSIVQAFFNALYAWGKVRYPWVAKLGNVATEAQLFETENTGKGDGAGLYALLPFLLIPALLVAGCTPAQKQAAAMDAQKLKDAWAKAEPVLLDIEAGFRDLAPCAPAVVMTVAQAIAGSPGWMGTLVDNYVCISQGIAKLRADIAANRTPPPSPEHVQAVQSLVSITRAVRAMTVPAPAVIVADPPLDMSPPSDMGAP